jgi:hypothetical protein
MVCANARGIATGDSVATKIATIKLAGRFSLLSVGLSESFPGASAVMLLK